MAGLNTRTGQRNVRPNRNINDFSRPYERSGMEYRNYTPQVYERRMPSSMVNADFSGMSMPNIDNMELMVGVIGERDPRLNSKTAPMAPNSPGRQWWIEGNYEATARRPKSDDEIRAELKNDPFNPQAVLADGQRRYRLRQEMNGQSGQPSTTPMAQPASDMEQWAQGVRERYGIGQKPQAQSDGEGAQPSFNVNGNFEMLDTSRFTGFGQGGLDTRTGQRNAQPRQVSGQGGNGSGESYGGYGYGSQSSFQGSDQNQSIYDRPSWQGSVDETTNYFGGRLQDQYERFKKDTKEMQDRGFGFGNMMNILNNNSRETQQRIQAAAQVGASLLNSGSNMFGSMQNYRYW